MKTIKYSVSNVGRDAKNPLLDIHQTDEQWYFDTLVNMTSTCSDIGQYTTNQLHQKQSKVWCL